MQGAHLYVGGDISLAHLSALTGLKHAVSLSALRAYILDVVVMT